MCFCGGEIITTVQPVEVGPLEVRSRRLDNSALSTILFYKHLPEQERPSLKFIRMIAQGIGKTDQFATHE